MPQVSRKIQTIAALGVLIAAAGTLALVIREYRRDVDACRLLYTRSIKKKDIVDSARNALSALNDAELREQNYVLTGETVYSEAYADDIRAWQDESASLALVAVKDPATAIVQDFSKAGMRMVDELALVASLYEKNGRDSALERIRKSAGIVYLDQVRSVLGRIQDVDGGNGDGTTAIISKAGGSLRRLAEGGIALFLLAAVSSGFLILKIRGES